MRRRADGPGLRPARPEDARFLSALAFRSKGHWGYTPEFMEACRAELSVAEADFADPCRHYVVAESDRTIVGYYALERLSPEECELDALFLEPDWIGHGIGRGLMEHAKAHARSWGSRSMLIQGDPNASAFYLAAGGIQIGERASDSIPGRYLPEFRILLDDRIVG